MDTRVNTIRIEPLTGAIGAEIHGVDLAIPLDHDMFARIHQALLDYLVIFFRDQELTPEQHKNFARQFGELDIHQYTAAMQGHPEIIEVIKEPEETHNWGDNWHTDLTGLPEPPLGSVLYAKEVPPFGGDTQWSNMYLAYATLSDAMKQQLDGLRVVHTSDDSGYQRFRAMSPLPGPAYESEHPLVRTHPVTGKKSLFIARKKMRQISGMTPEESAALLNFVCDHAENPDFACRFRWRKGSIAFWDNRCTQHRVSADYFYALRGIKPHRRHMHRVTIKGDRPR
jgi:taurine dioxygenase